LSETDRPVSNLGIAWEVVCQRLRTSDIQEQCRRAGARCLRQDAGFQVTIHYFGQPYVILLPEVDLVPEPGSAALPLREKVLVLHYLAGAKGTATTGRQVTYRELPGGMVYFPTFAKRTAEALSARFGQDAPLLISAGRRMGGRPGDIGDASLVFDVFPRVAVTVVLWQGDEELPPRMNLLFDANITDYLEPEDVTVACEVLTWRLVHASRQA
jgi:hypothetical protein